uniref:Transposase n=1 Tax=Ditylenchus dipsaci TaxID=166011 RepID=A0A915EEM2_9BILA
MDRIQAAYGSDSSAEEEVEKLRKRKSYSTEWKLEVVKHARLVSIHSASKKFNVDRATVRDWIKSQNSLSQIKQSSAAGKNRKRLLGGGRPLQFQDLDRELAKWVRQNVRINSESLAVSSNNKQRKCLTPKRMKVSLCAAA